MSNWAEVAGVRVTSGTVTIPYRGLWVGDVTLAKTGSVGPVATLTLGNLVMRCGVFRELDFAGSHTCRLVGGFGGWQTTIPAKAYSLQSGVPLSIVLREAAIEAGEVISSVALNSIAGQNVGTFYVRELAPASRVLKQLAEPLWWVDASGQIQLTDRSVLAFDGTATATLLGAITSQFQPIVNEPGAAHFTVAHESPADWMPGRIFSNALIPTPQTISMVTHCFTDGGALRTKVLTTTRA